MRPDNLSIRWKLFLYMSVFVFIMIIVLWLFQTVFLNSFYKAVKTHQVKNLAKQVEKNIDSDGLPDLISEILQRDNSMNVFIYSEKGEVLFSPFAAASGASGASGDFARFQIPSPEPPQRIEDLIGRAKGAGIVAEVHLTGEPQQTKPAEPPRLSGAVIRLGPRRSENILQMSEVINSSGSKVYILISALITPVDATVSTLRFQLIYITVLLIFIALLLSLYISQRFARPIMEINEVAKRLAQGNYDVEFNTDGYREIKELNDTLNSAAYELSRVEGLRRELLANVSHDLRTPLTMITGFAEMICDLPGENTPENARVIVEESNRLTRLVGDLLDISRLESGNMETEKSVFCLTDTVADSVSRMSAALADGRLITFEPDEEAYVCANESQIIQVIYNLLANAVNYSGGDVAVTQYVNENTVRIEVRDSGQGISEADLPYVWDRYYKASGPHKRANIGTGLGLSIVKGVIAAHNGKCGVKSAEGSGSVFWFELDGIIESSQ